MSDESEQSMGERMGWAALLLSASIFLSRLLGFLRDAIVAYLHGASPATDAYYAAFTLPGLMRYFLAGGTLSITFIPFFSSYVTEGDEAGGWKLFSNIATIMGCTLIVVTLALEGIAPWAVPRLNPGFTSGHQIEMAVWMTRIVIPAQLAFYIGGLLQSTLFVKEVFWPSAVAPLVYNVCIILGGVLLDPTLGIAGFAVGALVGAFLGPLGLPLWAARREIEYTPRFDLTDSDFRAFVALTIPLMLGVGLLTADKWLLRYFGSHVEGAITWLNNSRKLMMVVFAIIGQAAGQAALPYLSRLYSEDRTEEMGEMLAGSLRRVGFLAIVGTAGLIVAAEPMVYVVFRRGAFSVADAQSTSQLLFFFALGLVGWTIQSLANRGFYARKNTVTPMIVGTAVFAVALPLYYLLFEQFGPVGLAAATSIGISLNALATVLVYRFYTDELPLAPIGLGLARGALFGGVAALAAEGVRWFAGWQWAIDLDFLGHAIPLLAAMGAAFFGAAGLLALVYRPPEIETVWSKVADKIGI
jgi:putative peptidoglycan lipid II flippase